MNVTPPQGKTRTIFMIIIKAKSSCHRTHQVDSEALALEWASCKVGKYSKVSLQNKFRKKTELKQNSFKRIRCF